MREQSDSGSPNEEQPDERTRPVAVVPKRVGGDGIPCSLIGDHEQGRAVDEKPSASEKGQDDEPDAVEEGIDVEVAAEAAAHARDHAIRAAPAELFVRRGLSHTPSLLRQAIRVDPANPWFGPERALADRLPGSCFVSLSRHHRVLALASTAGSWGRMARRTIQRGPSDVRPLGN